MINFLMFQGYVIEGAAALPALAMLVFIIFIGLRYVFLTAMAETGFWKIMFLFGIIAFLLSIAGALPTVDGNGNYKGLSKPIIQSR